MKRLSKKQKWGPLILGLLLLCIVGMATADNYVGGQPLTTVQSGTVNGGLYMDDNLEGEYVNVRTKTFAEIPDISDIQWARLYISAYSGHMQEARAFEITTKFDGNNDGDWDDNTDRTWTETASTTFTFIANGGNDNTAQGGSAHDPFLIVNDHMNRVTSDYLMWYDVTELIGSTTPTVNVNASASYDGRIKVITLVVAYNDGDMDNIRYWVNQGHDVDSYYSEEDYIGSTAFSLSGISGTVNAATLRVNHMASTDGTYKWRGTSISNSTPGEWQGGYSGGNTWDVTSTVQPGSSNALTYNRSADFYKIALATLEVDITEGGVEPPVAAFSFSPESGDAPLTVQFTDESENSPTAWSWDFGDGEFSEEQHPIHEFVRAGTYAVSLTATNSAGDDTTTHDITVTSMWKAKAAWDAPDPGSLTAPCLVDLDNDGDYDLLTGENGGSSIAYENIGALTSPTWSARTGWNVPDIGARAKPAAADLDGDGDYDLMVGSTAGTSYGYENAGSITSPTWTPNTTWNTVDIGTYSAPALADLDDDGDYDLLIGSSTGNCIGYENTGSASAPTWSRKTAWDTPDVGSNSVPAFLDIDGDSDLDLLIGDGTGVSFGFENTDSAASPAWTEKPPWDVPDIGTEAAPGPADLDNDGDFDLLVGSNAGTPYSYENTAPPLTGCDLTISGTVNVAPPTVLFAREENSVRIASITNNGPGTSPATEVLLTSSDGFSGRVDVPSLGKNEATTVTIIDTTIRDTAGGSVTYTATVDPDNIVTETNEGNNHKTSGEKTVTYNGYKGKRYWTGTSDVTTKRIFDLHGGILYSSGDSVYKSGGVGGGSWNDYTVTWTSGDLLLPEGATIREARLYVPYTWDNSNQVPDHFSVTFNGNLLTDTTWYKDESNFGARDNYYYGLLAYNVTDYFATGGNSAIIHKDDAGSNLAMYGLTLAVVYEKAGEPRRQIFLNEEFDLLGADQTGYATTPEEATAYVPFTGMTIAPDDVIHAYLTTFVPSGNGPEGDLLWNNNTVATHVWDHGPLSGTQVAVDTRDMKDSLLATGNEAGIRSTPGSTPAMAVSHAFLVVEYPTTPATIDITMDPGSVFFGNMIAGQDAMGSTMVNVVANGGSSWTVTASDGKPTNRGYMVKDTTPLTNPIQLGKDDAAYQALTSDYTNFMSGSTMGSFSATASLKQAVAEGDAPGDYTITLTFTGSVS